MCTLPILKIAIFFSFYFFDKGLYSSYIKILLLFTLVLNFVELFLLLLFV